MKRQCKPTAWPSLSLAVFAAVLAATVPSRADDWHFVRRDIASTGVAESALPDALDVVWEYQAPGDAGFEATAVVVAGVIYVGDNEGTFHAVRLADGTAVWTKSFDDANFLAGAASDGQHLFVGDANGIVRCLAMADGAEVWSASVEAEVYAGPTVYDGRVLVTCEAGGFVAFDAASGEQQWKFEIDAPLRCTPTVVAGRVLLAGCDSKLHLIDATNGTQLSTVDIDAPTGATAAARDGRAYFGTEGGTFFAVDMPSADDELPAVAWTYRDPDRGQPIRSAAAVSDKLVAYGGQGKAVYALDPASGALKWRKTTRSRVDSSPVIAGDRVVAATERGIVYLLDAATGEAKWQFEAGGSFTASPVVVAGRIILGNGNGTLYCFGSKKRTTEGTESTVKKD